ncbi:MAG: type IV toxin-antitoxin system AbiEi family antitoxin domain-containing protein [Anaerolineales bacterium]|nr:type IV toxin-antitoxin system AbiEi family antitoxin domain-containing protein [Anaerolineales bacterium]
MKSNKFQTAKGIFQKRHGILRRREALKLGVPEYVIYEMTKSGDLIKEARGLYRLAESEPLSDPDLVQASLLIPKGVVFLISALYFHRLTTQIPHWIYLALPRGTKPSKVEYPPVKAFIRSEKQYAAGVEEHTIDGVRVRIYSREKTVADCFMYQREIGKDVALEALKDYMAGKSRNVNKLMEYAKVNRVEKSILPYVESLL